MKAGGRLLLLSRIADGEFEQLRKQLAVWCGAAGLRLAPPRKIPAREPHWLLAVGSVADLGSAAA